MKYMEQHKSPSIQNFSDCILDLSTFFSLNKDNGSHNMSRISNDRDSQMSGFPSTKEPILNQSGIFSESLAKITNKNKEEVKQSGASV